MDKRKIIIIISLIAIVGSIAFRVVKIIQNKGVEKDNSTNSSCFVFNADTGAITGYYYNLCGKDVIIPDELKGVKVKLIEEAVFENMELTSVTLPKHLESIMMFAFHNNKLEEITIPSTVTYIGPDAFKQNKISKLEILSNNVEIGNGAFNNNQLPDETAFIYQRINGEDKTTIVSYGGSNRVNVVIPNDVITISNDAFVDNDIISVVLNKKLTHIGDNAFNGNKIKKVAIPENVDYFGDSAFNYDIQEISVVGKKEQKDFGYFGTQNFDINILKFDKDSKKQVGLEEGI